MIVKKLIEKMDDNEYISLGYHGDCLFTNKVIFVPERFCRYKVKKIWLGRMSDGTPKINVDVKWGEE